jgi:ATP-binding cassette subfamily F protein uup
MDLLLNCRAVSKSIGPRLLFDAVSFTVNRGERLGIIGANGTGKTTLLRLLSGLDTPDSGKVTLTGNIRTGYLAQSDTFPDHETAAGVLYHHLRDLGLDDAEQYSRAHSLLSRAEFADPDCVVKTLSGGWRKRLSICRALVRRPDILLMDEPTNHLDLQGILWLEKLLGSSFPESPAACILVSHDRVFLENLTSRTIEISPMYPAGFFAVEGNYALFQQRKEEFLEQQEEHETRLANRSRRETEWLRRGPKARSTKAKYRIDEAHRLHCELARIQKRNRIKKKIQIDFTATDRKTKKLLEARTLAKSFDGRVLFSDLDIILTPGRRIGLLGPNGSGKSTLMHILAGSSDPVGMRPDSGSITIAEGVNIVSFSQNREQLDLSATLRQALAPEGETIVYRDQPLHIVTWAGKFLFTVDQLDTPVGNLSGGEQAKILIADLMRQPADILLLDEPTNDLDIPSLQVLEESLLEFPGSVVLVTHDRYLMDRVCDRVLGFDGRGGTDFFADYQQWIASLKADEKGPGKRADSTKQQEKGKRKRKKEKGRLSYMDQREYDSMEEKILQAEEEEQLLTRRMEHPEITSDPKKLHECWEQLENVRTTIHQLYQRWEELENKKEGKGL